MRKIFALFVCLCALTGHTQPSAPDNEGHRGQLILILSPQGVQPSMDTVGFNNLVRNVTQGFSARLVEVLGARGVMVENVLDQEPRTTAGQKLALYSSKFGTPSAIVLTVQHAQVGDDSQLNLHVEYVEQNFLRDGTKVVGVQVTSKLERTYLLRGSRSGDNPSTVSDLARDFVGMLDSEHRL